MSAPLSEVFRQSISFTTGFRTKLRNLNALQKDRETFRRIDIEPDRRQRLGLVSREPRNAFNDEPCIRIGSRQIAAFMDERVKLTESLRIKCGGANIRLHTETWRGVPGERIHRDIVHLRYGQPVIDAVNDMLVDDLGLKIEERPGVALYGKQAAPKKQKTNG